MPDMLPCCGLSVTWSRAAFSGRVRSLRLPLEQPPFEPIDGNPHHEYAGGEYGDPGKDACRVEHAFCLRDQVADPPRRAEVFAHHYGDDGQADADVEAREDPGQHARDEDVPNQLTLGCAQHPRVVDDHAIDLTHTTKRVEEHDEENDGDATRELRPDPSTAPQKKDRSQDHARQRVR